MLPSFPPPASCSALPWLRVGDVEPDSIAAHCGLEVGDLIGVLNGVEFAQGMVQLAKNLVPQLALENAGTTLTMPVWSPSFGSAPGSFMGNIRNGRMPFAFLLCLTDAVFLERSAPDVRYGIKLHRWFGSM
jgi:hypothetical protein